MGLSGSGDDGICNLPCRMFEKKVNSTNNATARRNAMQPGDVSSAGRFLGSVAWHCGVQESGPWTLFFLGKRLEIRGPTSLVTRNQT